MRLVLVALFALVPMQSALAVDLIEQTFALSIEPRTVLNQDLHCPDEQLISGGFALAPVSEGALDAVSVIASTRQGSGTWRVGLYNAADTAMSVELSISIMCD